MTMIPQNLIEQIKSKNIILFLGSGASIGATSTKNDKIPSSQALADRISNKYLGENYMGKPLNYVSELAINESSLFEFQSFIYDIFSIFNPAEFHKKIPLFQVTQKINPLPSQNTEKELTHDPLRTLPLGPPAPSAPPAASVPVPADAPASGGPSRPGPRCRPA